MKPRVFRIIALAWFVVSLVMLLMWTASFVRGVEVAHFETAAQGSWVRSLRVEMGAVTYGRANPLKMLVLANEWYARAYKINFNSPDAGERFFLF